MEFKDFHGEVLAAGLGWVKEMSVQMAEECLDHCPNQTLEIFGSPLEAKFFTWWWTYRKLSSSTRHYNELGLYPQYEVAVDGHRYRLDFMVSLDDAPRWFVEAHDRGLQKVRIGVELDGHDFHERTKEQVALRDSRDRALQKANWKIFHFSGSEFFRRPTECISEVYYFADDIFMDLWHEWYAVCEEPRKAAQEK